MILINLGSGKDKGSIKKSTNKLITPLASKVATKQLFGVLDIETISIKGQLYPYAIGIAYLKQDKFCEKYLYLDLDSSKTLEDRSSELLKRACEYIDLKLKGYTIYTHNLGSFDGYFILKPFLNYFGPYKLLIDTSHTIISINLPGDITFKDSLRILPLSLEKLGKLFETKHRKLEFDHTTATISNIEKPLFKVKLISYLQNDCLCLLEVLIKASRIINDMFGVDLHDSYSTSSLAFLVYRTKYINTEYIPTLPLWLDKIIRTSYRGGSVDVYKVIGNRAHYYDVNSLYPHGICNDMPFDYLGFKYKPDLDKFFGFAYAYITVPKGTKVPLVPIKAENGSLFYPTGRLSGLFFSEELKIFISQGYKVFTLYGYEFSRKEDLFTKYVEDIYNLKVKVGESLKNNINKSATDRSLYLIYKLLLNGLYGYFGRNPDTLTVIFINYEQTIDLRITHRVIDQITITDDLYLTVADTMPDKTLCSENDVSYIEAIIKTPLQHPIKTNVAICSAITSYSRIQMALFKTLPNNVLLYSDTDSVFLIYPLDPKYISPTVLGLLKDELEGEVITEFLFLEPKLYYYKTPTKEVIKARGVKEGYMTRELMYKLYQGETVNFVFPRLYKSFEKLNIHEKTINYSLKMQFDRKIRVYNTNGKLIAYQPKHMHFKFFK
jgi:hypothetical protein